MSMTKKQTKEYKAILKQKRLRSKEERAKKNPKGFVGWKGE